MAITLGGNRWNEASVYDDGHIPSEDEELSPLDDDYIPGEYRDYDD